MASDTEQQLNDLKNDVKDGADEVKNRAQAAGEHLKRKAAGDDMPLGERIASNVKETLHNAKADFDSAKRDVRHDDTDRPATDKV